MKFRIVILTVLILALVGLVVMFYQNMQKLDYLEKQAKQQEFNKKEDAQRAELEALKNEIQNLKGNGNFVAPGARADAANASPIPDRLGSKTDRELALERQLAMERQKNEVISQESKLILRNEQGKRDETVKQANEVDNARVVGKIQLYDKNNNILIFAPVGQPSLVNGQELAIKRKSSIFAYIKVEGLDQESGSYSGEVILDDYFSIENDQDPLSQGEEIIIPPASMSRKLPDLDTMPQPGKAASPAGEKAPEVTPWQEI